MTRSNKENRQLCSMLTSTINLFNCQSEVQLLQYLVVVYNSLRYCFVKHFLVPLL